MSARCRAAARSSSRSARGRWWRSRAAGARAARRSMRCCAAAGAGRCRRCRTTRDGYLVTSLPEDRRGWRGSRRPGCCAFVRQRYMRYPSIWRSASRRGWRGCRGTRDRGMKRKAKKIAAASGGALDVRAYRTPDELAAFHPLARGGSRRRPIRSGCWASGLPDDARFPARAGRAAADRVRAWLLFIDGVPAAYLYCPIRRRVDCDLRSCRARSRRSTICRPARCCRSRRCATCSPNGGSRGSTSPRARASTSASSRPAGSACVDLLLLRPTLANRAAMAALRAFDRAMALAKRARRTGLAKLAQSIRR